MNFKAYALSLLLLGAHTGWAQPDRVASSKDETDPRRSVVPETSAGMGEASMDQQNVPIDVQADRLEYRDGRKVIIAKGNVTITHGDDILQADSASVNTETYDAHARGGVYIRRGWVACIKETKYGYNFSTRQGDFMDFGSGSGPTSS